MTEQNAPRESLKQFDEFDLDNMIQRRLAAHSLRDFYGMTMSRVGQRYLGFEPSIRKQPPQQQWYKIKTRLEVLNGFEIPDDFSGLPHMVTEISNDVDHDYDENPPRERLKNAREEAERWQSWLTELGKEYVENKAELNTREMIIKLAKRTSQSTIQSSEHRLYGLNKEQSELDNEAEDILKRIDNLPSNTEEVTNELIFILLDAKDMEQREEWLNDVEHGLDAEIEMKIDESREEAAFQRMQEQKFKD